MKSNSKKIALIGLAASVLFGTAGCSLFQNNEPKVYGPAEPSYEDSSSQDTAPEQTRVFVYVTDIKDNVVYVKPEDGAYELNSSDSFTLNLDEIPEKDDIKVGVELEIIYSGRIEESYPAHFGGIYSVSIVKDSQGEMVTTEAIEVGPDDNEMPEVYGAPIDDN